ncbi:serine protease [Streptomyces sp. NPDC090077]|uniref:serine protease n=1 Tax=Streptomyces sp. NPDC090077 TaxID=3365938 RepID=UPI0037F2A144
MTDEVTDGTGEAGRGAFAGAAGLVTIRDRDGIPRGSGFVADHRGTVITSCAAVAGVAGLVLHAPGAEERARPAEADDVTVLPELGLALVRSAGLEVPPLPVAMCEAIPPGTYVRLPARGWRQARVLGAGAEVTHTAAGRPHVLPAAVELAIGTAGRDALRLGGEVCGGPVLDAATGAVLAVLGTALAAEHRSGSFAVPLRAAAASAPGGPLAELLERNSATVPGYGADLNLAGALELTGTTLGSAFPPATAAEPAPDPVPRPGITAGLAAFTAGTDLVLGLVGAPGTGRTTALAALAADRARGARPAPTLWLRGADLRDGDASLADAVTRALTAAGRILTAGPAAAGSAPGPAAPGSAVPGPSGHGPSGRGPEPARPGQAVDTDPTGRTPAEPGEPGPFRSGTSGAGAADPGWSGPGPVGPAGSGSAPVGSALAGTPGGPGTEGEGVGERVARLAGDAGRALLVVLDAPEEMPPRLAQRLAPWTTSTAAWLCRTGARLVVAARPEYWERAGELYPPELLHTPARAARRLPPALPVGDLTPQEAGEARARLGIPDGAVREADARHPLTLRLLAGIRAAEVTAGRPGRDEVFAAHLDLVALRVAVRIAAAAGAGRGPGAGPGAGPASGAGVHGPGVRRLAARVAGRVHEAARRCLGPGRGQLDRAAFEELFPWRTGWASAVLTEGLLVPAGPGYRFAHEELSDWLQAGHLDVPGALDGLVHHGPADAGPPVPRHRIGPVLEALRRLPPAEARGRLDGLVAALNAFAEQAGQAGQDPGPVHPDRVWWASRLLRATLLGAADATPYLPVLHALAEHVARSGSAEFGGWFWNRLRLPECDRLDLLRRLLPSDHHYLEAAGRRLARAPRLVLPLVCAWFTDERRLRGRPGATVATAAQALLHTHRGLAVDDLTEALVGAAHPRADELLAVLAEDEPSALCRAVGRWAHDERPERRVAAAAYGLATAPHVRTPADRELLRHAAQALLDRPGDTGLHGPALGMLLRDPQARARYLPDALACFGDPAGGSRLPASALVAALPVLPDPDAVFAALRARADGEVIRALAALTTPGLARRAGDLVRDHLGRRPEDAPHAAAFVDRRLDQGPAAGPVLRPLVLALLRGAPPQVRAELAGVLAAPGAESSYPLRAELADVLLREESDAAVLGAFLAGLAAGSCRRPEARTRELLRRTGRQLLRAPGGPAVFEHRTVELARADPVFGALVSRWLTDAATEAAALLGPGARRTVETLRRAAPDIT